MKTHTVDRVTQLTLELKNSEDMLEPYLGTITQVMHKSWFEWQRLQTTMPDIAGKFSPRTRASIMYDLICGHVITNFSDDKEVKCIDSKGLLVLVLFDKFVVRFRKFNKAMSVGRNNTLQSKLYFENLQPSLKGLVDDQIPIIAGYKLDSLAGMIEKTALTLQWKKSPQWMLSVADSIDIEEVPVGGVESDKPFRVRPINIPKLDEGKWQS